MRRPWVWLAVCVLAAVVGGCEKGGKPPLVPINEINQNVDKYAGKNVEVHGTVQKTVASGGQAFYELVADGGGAIFVKPRGDKSPPSLEKVRMIGRVEKNYMAGGTERPILLIEVKWLHITSAKGKALVDGPENK